MANKKLIKIKVLLKKYEDRPWFHIRPEVAEEKSERAINKLLQAKYGDTYELEFDLDFYRDFDISVKCEDKQMRREVLDLVDNFINEHWDVDSLDFKYWGGRLE